MFQRPPGSFPSAGNDAVRTVSPHSSTSAVISGLNQAPGCILCFTVTGPIFVDKLQSTLR